ncbi:N-(5'-phosphoribosyl)anthranilate isomerase [bacterium HR30]|nr:N-(5'-phosphoribosyl)anthranilate isomerase [bacterium HR30]
MVVVKICGITTCEDAIAAARSGADWLGLNFWQGSPRHVTRERAREIVAALPPHIRKVGVFVNATREEVESTAAELGLDLLQFHGDEPPEYCQGWRWPVIKAVRGHSKGDLEAACLYRVDYFLVDAQVPGRYGGTGQRANWAAVAQWAPGRPVILAGGLNPENVSEAIRLVRPFGVDVASGVETSPGAKDPGAMRRFVQNAKSA